MAAPSEFLRRFRLHVVPGAPTAVPAPADRGAELAAEVAPVFAALEDAQRRAAAMVASAEREAAAHRARSAAQRERVVADARAGRAAARARSSERRLGDADRERERVLAAGRTEADRVARLAAARMPAVVDDVVRRVLAQAGALPAPGPDEGTGRTTGRGDERGS